MEKNARLRKVIIAVRLTEAEHAALKSMADKDNRSISAMVRSLVIEALKQSDA
jgi:hypothetical protein